MQKLKQKLNAKPVGAGLVPAQNKGITLIALIITIIVMLILVGVTINVALNGGLFGKAKIAKNETEKALEKEELIQIAVGEYNEKNQTVNADNVKTQLGANYIEDTSKSKEGETLVLKGKSGILWEINLKSTEVKEYEKTKTIWDERGLTSPNVKIGSIYYNDEIELITDSGNYGLTLGLLEDGSLCYAEPSLEIDTSEIFLSDEVDYYINQNYAKVGTDYIRFIDEIYGIYVTFTFNSNDTVTVFTGLSINDENLEEIGTLILQQ